MGSRLGDILNFPWRDAVYGERERREQAEAAGNVYWLAERLNLKKRKKGKWWRCRAMRKCRSRGRGVGCFTRGTHLRIPSVTVIHAQGFKRRRASVMQSLMSAIGAGSSGGAYVDTPPQQSSYQGDASAVPTLVRALSRADGLNDRLAKIVDGLNEIANAVGGPRPLLHPDDKPQPPTAASAMAVLNDRIDVAHRRALHIEDAISAIQRSLGG